MRWSQFTIRRLMVAVAVFGVGFAILRMNRLIGSWLLATLLMAWIWSWAARRRRAKQQFSAVLSRVLVFYGFLALTVVLSIGLSLAIDGFAAWLIP